MRPGDIAIFYNDSRACDPFNGRRYKLKYQDNSEYTNQPGWVVEEDEYGPGRHWINKDCLLPETLVDAFKRILLS